MTILVDQIQLDFQNQNTGHLVTEASFQKSNEFTQSKIDIKKFGFELLYSVKFKIDPMVNELLLTLNFGRSQTRHQLYYFAPFQTEHHQNLNKRCHFCYGMFLIYFDLSCCPEKTWYLTEKTFFVLESQLHPKYLLEIQQESVKDFISFLTCQQLSASTNYRNDWK